MVYGPRLEFPLPSAPDVTVIMRPAQLPDDAAAMNGYLQDRVAIDFVTLNYTPTMAQETEHFEKCGQSRNTYAWIVAVRPDGEAESLVGITSLEKFGDWETHRRLSSGILLSNRQWWGKGIAGATHRLRTWYAFNVLGAHAINSSFVAENLGSGRALASVGYTEVGRNQRSLLKNGRWRDEVLLTCYNPAALPIMWPDGDIPQPIQAAAEKTKAALAWADSVLQPR